MIEESSSHHSYDNCSHKSSSSSDNNAKFKQPPRGEGVSTIKRADEEEVDKLSNSVQQREKEDRDKLNAVRTLFYSLNERFEQLLKFKPIRKVQVWETEMNLEAAYSMMGAFKV